jgi:hypothetical protein
MEKHHQQLLARNELRKKEINGAEDAFDSFDY